MPKQKASHHDSYCHHVDCKKWVQRARHLQHSDFLTHDATILPPASQGNGPIPQAGQPGQAGNPPGPAVNAVFPPPQAGQPGQAGNPPGPAVHAVFPPANCPHAKTVVKSHFTKASQTFHDESGKVVERRQYTSGVSLLPTCTACGQLTGVPTHEQFAVPAFPARNDPQDRDRSETIPSDDSNDDEEEEEDDKDGGSLIDNDEELEEEEEYEENDGEDEQE